MKTAAVACITFLYVLPCPTALVRSTVVLTRRSGSWKIVHEHYSRLTEEH